MSTPQFQGVWLSMVLSADFAEPYQELLSQDDCTFPRITFEYSGDHWLVFAKTTFSILPCLPPHIKKKKSRTETIYSISFLPLSLFWLVKSFWRHHQPKLWCCFISHALPKLVLPIFCSLTISTKLLMNLTYFSFLSPHEWIWTIPSPWVCSLGVLS